MSDLGRCWLWLGATDRDGYGRFSVGGQTRSAHRFAWTLARGPIAHGLLVLHAGDHRRCVDRAPRRAGAHRQNRVERSDRDRVAKGARKGRAKLTPEKVRAIRAADLADRVSATRRGGAATKSPERSRIAEDAKIRERNAEGRGFAARRSGRACRFFGNGAAQRAALDSADRDRSKGRRDGPGRMSGCVPHRQDVCATTGVASFLAGEENGERSAIAPYRWVDASRHGPALLPRSGLTRCVFAPRRSYEKDAGPRE